jgi:hypothetical protein
LCRLGLPIALVIVSLEIVSRPAKADPRGSLRLPVSCVMGTDCFVQQMPDIDSSSGVLDPFVVKQQSIDDI